MSINYSVTLVCDECTARLTAVAGPFAAPKKQARSVGYENGWQFVNTKDYCAKCWAEFVAGRKATLTRAKDLLKA